MEPIPFTPIGVLHAKSSEKYACPRQPMEGLGPSEGCIELVPGRNLEQAIEDLAGFSHIWILGHFNQATHWKPKIQPPRGDRKVGCLASRSPHRPNPISLSVVPLRAIKGRQVWIGHHDLLDGTPILDIKPYLEDVDRLSNTRSGWLEELGDQRHALTWSPSATDQLNWLTQRGVPLLDWIVPTLCLRPEPSPNNRVTPQPERGEGIFELAIKSWRIDFRKEPSAIHILGVRSGYLPSALLGEESSPWDDLPLHRDFLEHFYP